MNLVLGRYKVNLLSFLLALYCMLLPFEEVILTPFGSLLKIVAVAIMAVILLSYKKIRIAKIWTLMIAWFGFAILSMLWSNSTFWWTYFMKIYVGQIVFTIMVANLPFDSLNLLMIKKGLVLGATFAAVLILFFPTNSTFTDDGRRTLILFGANMDPNILASILLMAWYVLLSIIEKDIPKSKNKALYYLLMFLFPISSIMTGSRGALVALIASCTIMACIFLKRKNNRKLAFRLLMIGIVLIFLMILFLPDDLVLARFQFDNILGINEYKAGVHNRYSIWFNAFKLFCDRPLLGYGCGNFFSAIATIYRECASHNLFVLSLVELGVIGSIPLFLFFYLLLKKLYKSKDVYSLCMSISIFIIALTLDSLPYKYFWIMLIFSWFAIRNGDKKNGFN